MTVPSKRDTFADIWSSVQDWLGWLRPGQAERLWNAATRVPPEGTLVEIGSFRGKSTAVLAHGSPSSAHLYAIDPHAGNDRGPGEWTGTSESGEQDNDAFIANLSSVGLRHRVEHVREFSQDAHGMVPGPVDFLYVDGAHGYRPASDDLCCWGERVTDGGEMHVHDVFNSIWVTMAILRHVAFSRRWRYVGRERSLAMYQRERVSVARAALNGARHLAMLPVLVRVAVVKGLRGLDRERWARFLGHTPGAGTY